MKKSIIRALLVALPVELASFYVFPFPDGIALPTDVDEFVKIMGIPWTLAHLVGLQMARWVDGDQVLMGQMIEFGGYAEFAIIFFFIFLALDVMRRRNEEKVLDRTAQRFPRH